MLPAPLGAALFSRKYRFRPPGESHMIPLSAIDTGYGNPCRWRRVPA